jgi:hypothetical protein
MPPAISPLLLMLPFEIDRTPKVTQPICRTQASIVERCRGRRELVPELGFEKVDR